MLKRQPGRERRIQQEIDRTRRQIGHLVDAIADGAKVDAEGTPIDLAYLDRAVNDELRIAGHLVEEVDIALDFLRTRTPRCGWRHPQGRFGFHCPVEHSNLPTP